MSSVSHSHTLEICGNNSRGEKKNLNSVVVAVIAEDEDALLFFKCIFPQAGVKYADLNDVMCHPFGLGFSSLTTSCMNRCNHKVLENLYSESSLPLS